MSLEEIKRSVPYPSFRQIVASMLHLSIPLCVAIFGGMFLFAKYIAPPAVASAIPDIGFIFIIGTISVLTGSTGVRSANAQSTKK